ncbi:unnamed protein product [Linum trigynum]|uniref:Gnk2-homologous domain-containing protein n=1 Tax=Linum trigynum TaxID=586398 RepID=A0AAV2EZ42_9ROSI
MTRSPSLGKKLLYNIKVPAAAVTAAVLLLVTISLGRITTAQDMNFLCNPVRYALGDRRRPCVYSLLTLMYQLSDPPAPGEWYGSFDCDGGRYTLYGYRRADKGADGGAAGLECLRKARDILRTGKCAGRMGGRAVGEGCYMRHEAYPFTEG